MKVIVAAVPGRLRLKHAALADAPMQEAFIARLNEMAAVTALRGNPSAASIVVEYDATAIALKEIEKEIAQIATQLLALPVSPRSKSGQTLKRRANRYAKYGAIASLAVSVASIYAGRKRLHVATGWLFLAFLGVHMYVHRKNTFR